MNSQDYWRIRAEQLARAQHAKADHYSEGELKLEFDRAMIEIRRYIEVFYQRFSNNNGFISLGDARKMLNGSELKEFNMDLETFIMLAKDNPDGRWTQILNNVYYKVRVTRLQALQIQVEASIQNLSTAQNKAMTALLSDVYSDTYYRTLFELQKGVGIGASFAKVDQKTVDTIIHRPWQESNFSKRIWGNNTKLVQQLQTEFTQSIIRGESSKKVAANLAERMEVGKKSAERLVRTEASHIQNEASFAAYKESGIVRKYEFLATLDSRTSDKCQWMDKKVFKLSEKEVGVNFPPLHVRCRSTTTAYFEDEISVGERIARGADGKQYNVPGNMTYKQWHDKYVS
ncbi:minor capsid protein [Paenibacillus sp. L3-i20]|uniref:minor capsid protein n=1 Tax=Paenibacillus sp. L3-i20 TaxID=2905833 RepID=UPI001EE09622|nr:minor capsid protein [Paenibacillus sp. L3-i20]GKU79869.1 prophage head protein [Paenibacillus sp. L3-i20]